MTLDHTCCLRCCVNPDHLEVVTSVENVKRVWRRIGHVEMGRRIKSGRAEAELKKTPLVLELQRIRNAFRRVLNYATNADEQQMPLDKIEQDIALLERLIAEAKLKHSLGI